MPILIPIEHFENAETELETSRIVDSVVAKRMAELDPEALAQYNESKTKELITDEDFKTAAEAHTKYLNAVNAQGNKIPTAEEILKQK